VRELFADMIECEAKSTQEADLDAFRKFVDATRWRFAKTYVESYPHEYMLEQWVDADLSREQFARSSSGGSWSPSGRLSEDTFTSTIANIGTWAMRRLRILLNARP